LAANADLIDLGTTTFDTDTGLEWLNLTETLGMSVNDLPSGLGLSGWELATTDDVALLFIAAGLAVPTPPPISTFLSVDLDVTNALMTLFGCTSRCGTGNDLMAGIMLASIDHGFTYEISDLRLNGVVGDEIFPARLIFDVVSNSRGADFSGPGVGLYLVRDVAEGPAGPIPVPEPSTLALLGLGIAGIGLTRRRKKT